MKTICFIGLLFCQRSIGTVMPDTQSSKLVQDEPKDHIELLEKYDGSPGYPIYNWYLHNKSTSKAIRVNIQFSNYSSYNGQSFWNQSFDLEPGDIEMIGNKTYDGTNYTTATIVGARYI